MVFSPLTASRATLALKAELCCLRMLTILPYLLSVYGRSKCTLSTCPDFGVMLHEIPYLLFIRGSRFPGPSISLTGAFLVYFGQTFWTKRQSSLTSHFLLADTLQTTQENCMDFVQNINFLILTLTPNYLYELTYKFLGSISQIIKFENLYLEFLIYIACDA